MSILASLGDRAGVKGSEDLINLRDVTQRNEMLVYQINGLYEENRNLKEKRSKLLVAMDNFIIGTDDKYHNCRFCGASIKKEHDDDCVVSVLSRAFLEYRYDIDEIYNFHEK